MRSPSRFVADAAAHTVRRSNALLTTAKRAARALSKTLSSRKKDKKKQKPTVPNVCVVGVGALDRGQVTAIKRIGKLVQDPGQATVLLVSPHFNLRSDANAVTGLLIGAASASFIVTTGLMDSIVSGLRHVPSLDHPNVVARIEAPSFCPGPPTAGPKFKDCVIVLVEAQSSQLLGQLRGAHLEHVVDAHGGFSVVVSGVDGLKDPKVVHDLTYHLSGSVERVLVVGPASETAALASGLQDIVDRLRSPGSLTDDMADVTESTGALEVSTITVLGFAQTCLGKGPEDLKPAPLLKDLMTDVDEGPATARLDPRVGERVVIRQWRVHEGRHVCGISEGDVEAIIPGDISGFVVQKGRGVNTQSRLVPTTLVAADFTTGPLTGERVYFYEDDPVLKAVEIPQFDSDAWARGGNAVATAWNGSGASSTIYEVSSAVARDHAPHTVRNDWEPLPIKGSSSIIERAWTSLVTSARRLVGRGSPPAPVAPFEREVIQQPCHTLIHSTAKAPDQTSRLDVNAEVNQGIVEARKANRSQTEQRAMKKASGALLQQLGRSLARSGGTHVYIWNLDDNENARHYTSRKKAAQTEMAREGYVHGDDPFHESYLDALFGVKIKDKARARRAKAWADRTSWRAAKNEADVPPDRKPQAWTDG